MKTKEGGWYKHCTSFFTQMLPGKIASDYAVKEIEMARDLNCDAVYFFVENEGMAIYNSGVLPKDPDVGECDLLADMICEAKKHGIKMVACWMGQHCQTYQVKEHPEWTYKHVSSEPGSGEMGTESSSYALAGVLCINSPFRDYLLRQVKEVLQGYEVDGVCFDGLYAPPSVLLLSVLQGEIQQHLR